MKRILYYSLLIITLINIQACDKFLDTKDYLNTNEENFPLTEEDTEMAIGAVYRAICNTQQYSVYFASDMTSDDRLSGGGMSDVTNHAIDQLKKDTESMFQTAWTCLYQGIFRLNKLLEAIDRDQVAFSSETNKNEVVGEAYFLRGYIYFELARLFGEVPLLTTSESVNIPKTPANEIYAQITSDLVQAINLLPAVRYESIPKSKLGHATKWAAEALLAREFLFYTGYYKSADLPLVGGGSVSKSQVVTWLEDCIRNSGHALVESDFRNLWPYTNPYTKEDYAYTAGKNLMWVGEENNPETVFALKFGITADWGHPFYSNWCQLCVSVRSQTDYTNTFPFGYGWGQGTINPKMVEQWIADEPNDTIRRWGSIIEFEHPREGMMYESSPDHAWNSGYSSKKYMAVVAWEDKEAKKTIPYAALMFNARNDIYFACVQDQVLIRFADVLLMHSELTETAEGINRVRTRAKIPSIAGYSLEALQKERRYELAFEGFRYHDLLRWYGTEAGVIIDQNQNGAQVKHNNVPATVQFELAKRIRETGGFYQIPLTEIDLSGGVLIQNKGWDISGITWSF
jgi:hypothetical protein